MELCDRVLHRPSAKARAKAPARRRADGNRSHGSRVQHACLVALGECGAGAVAVTSGKLRGRQAGRDADERLLLWLAYRQRGWSSNYIAARMPGETDPKVIRTLTDRVHDADLAESSDEPVEQIKAAYAWRKKTGAKT